MKYDLRERQEFLNIYLLQLHWCIGEVNALTATQSLKYQQKWFKHIRIGFILN